MFSFLTLLEFRRILVKAAKQGAMIGIMVDDHEGVVPIVPIHIGFATFTYDLYNPEDESTWLSRSTSPLYAVQGINYDHIERARMRLLSAEDEGSLNPDDDEDEEPASKHQA